MCNILCIFFQALIESMKNFKLQPDTQFFNMLIKKRNFRQDIKAARRRRSEVGNIGSWLGSRAGGGPEGR
ncbi:hypothetical protein E2C01_053129 [Portunus trituberculatus]|uniref:Uncharacterized protein n=1 Tax=Portunus trituberculatus TaxID=210409 RepID=A0A5B7GR68_PORTR|nr:hypothetical protein [Portunus trituberculatus]